MEGDINVEGLGLSIADRDILIEKTSIIFHLAANVRFDNTLKDAVFKNVRSTRDICILAEQMKNLLVNNSEHLKCVGICAYKRLLTLIFFLMKILMEILRSIEDSYYYNINFGIIIIVTMYLILFLQGFGACQYSLRACRQMRYR